MTTQQLRKWGRLENVATRLCRPKTRGNLRPDSTIWWSYNFWAGTERTMILLGSILNHTYLRWVRWWTFIQQRREFFLVQVNSKHETVYGSTRRRWLVYQPLKMCKQKTGHYPNLDYSTSYKVLCHMIHTQGHHQPAHFLQVLKILEPPKHLLILWERMGQEVNTRAKSHFQ